MNTNGDMENLENLIRRGKDGALSKEEVEVLALELDSKVPRLPLYTVLDILGEHHVVTSVSSIERFLRGPNPDLASKALQVLCRSWHLTIGYRDRLVELAKGAEWDEDEDAKRTALSIAGDFLLGDFDLDVLRIVYLTFINEEESDINRLIAYEALVRGIGHDYRRIPISPLGFNFREDIEPRVIETVANTLGLPPYR